MEAKLVYRRRSVNVHVAWLADVRGETGTRALAAGLGPASARGPEFLSTFRTSRDNDGGLGNAEFAEVPPQSRSVLWDHDWCQTVKSGS
jgi:hypothetical protein